MAQGSDREQHDPGDEERNDSRIMMFRVTPGETIHVETPQQRELRMRQRLPRPSWWRRAWSWIAAWWCGR